MQEWLSAIEKRWPSFKYLGFGFYYAWIFVCYNSSVLFPEPTHVLGFSAQSVLYLFSTFALAATLILSAFLRRFVTKLIAARHFVIVVGLGASVSTVLCVLQIPQTLNAVFLAGCVLTGVFTAFIALRFGMLYSAMGASRALANVAAAFLLAGAVYFIVTGLPYEMGLTLACCLPALAALCTCSYNASEEALADSLAHEGEGDWSSSSKKTRSFFVKLVIAICAFSAIYGFYNGLGVNLSNLAGNTPSASSNTIMVFLVILIAAVLLFASSVVKDSFNVSKLYYYIIVIACFAIVVFPLMGGYNDVQRILIAAVYNLFIMFVWCLFAHVAHRTSLTSVFVFGWGRGASAMGTTAGWLASTYGAPRLENNYDSMLAIAIVLTFILIVISLVVLKEGTINEALGATSDVQAEDDAAMGDMAPSSDEARVSAFAQTAAGAAIKDKYEQLSMVTNQNPSLQAAGLSDREIEVLQLLASGSTIEGISDELCISFNTAKSHVRHVYTKLDIHSRKELQAYLKTL